MRKPKWKRIAAVIGLFLIALQEREKDRVAEHLLFSSPKNSDYVPFDDHVHDSSDEYEISSTDDCEDYIYLQQEKDPMNNDISSSTQTSIINYANKASSPDEEE